MLKEAFDAGYRDAVQRFTKVAFPAVNTVKPMVKRSPAMAAPPTEAAPPAAPHFFQEQGQGLSNLYHGVKGMVGGDQTSRALGRGIAGTGFRQALPTLGALGLAGGAAALSGYALGDDRERGFASAWKHLY